MKDKTKCLLAGLVIGIIIGVAVAYILISSGLVRPLFFRDFSRFDNFTNFTNFTRPLRNAAGVA